MCVFDITSACNSSTYCGFLGSKISNNIWKFVSWTGCGKYCIPLPKDYNFFYAKYSSGVLWGGGSPNSFLLSAKTVKNSLLESTHAIFNTRVSTPRFAVVD